MKKTGITVLSVFTIFLVWTALYAIIHNPLLLPDPISVIIAFGKLFVQSASLSAIFSTVFRLLLAMSIATALGMGLAIVSAFRENVAVFLRPAVTVLRTVPVISVVVIILIVFGFSLTPYIITFLMIFPLIYQAVFGALKDIDKELIDVYRLEDNRFWSGLRYCYLPLIQNQIRTALLQAAGLGIKVLVMAEYLAQTRNSIGNSLYLAKVNLAYDGVFAWTLLLILLAVLLEIAIERSNFMKRPIMTQSSLEKAKE